MPRGKASAMMKEAEREIAGYAREREHTAAHRPQVVMLLANDFVHDTRVYKEACSLIGWGCDVHVLAMGGLDLPKYERNDGIHVHRVARSTRLLWILPVALACWWCRPVLRYLFSAPGAGDQRQYARGLRAFALRLWSMIRTLLLRMRWVAGRIWKLFLYLFGSPAVITVQRRLKRLFPTSFRLLACNIQFARKALALKPDIVQSHDLNTLMTGVIVKRLTGIPLVYDSHELFLERNLGDRSRAWDKAVWAPIERFCIRKCDAVLSVSESICRHLARQYNIPKPYLIRNVQPYEPPPAPTTILADELGISRDRPIVLFPGAITFNRGLEVMIDSAPFLNGAVYVIMGYARNPSYLESLKQRARELGQLNRRVFFREAVPIDQVVRYSASADLGIIPTPNVCLSYYYGLGNKHFHLLMAGVPLVTSDHPEQRMLIETYAVGAIFDETDPQDIARVVNDTLTNRGALEEMRQRCLVAAKSLNWEHEEKKLRQVFSALAGLPTSQEPNAVLSAATTSIGTATCGKIPLQAR